MKDNKIEDFQNDSQSQYQPSPREVQTKYISVKKHLSQANPLMQKVQFQPYRVICLYQNKIQLKKLPLELRGSRAKYQQETNMNKIQDSLFYHTKLKQKFEKLIKGGVEPLHQSLGSTLKQRYFGKLPYYWRKINKQQQFQHFGTTMIDLKGIQKKKKVNQSSNHSYPSNWEWNSSSSEKLKIQFDSQFQSGNLLGVFQKSEDIFQLILQNDINTKGNNQWFFFKVKNVPKGTTLKFNIVNLSKSDSLFNYGMKPSVFSKARYDSRKIGWVRQAQKVVYQANNIRRQHLPQHGHYTLSFQYKFLYAEDEVYFSHSQPYTYSDLNRYLQKLFQRKDIGKVISLKALGLSVAKNRVDLLSITNHLIANKYKKTVWIIARQHPSQTTSSFMIQGIIDFLVGDTPTAIYLRERIIFKIVPMLNVDGVIHGNSRCQLVGSDSNRKWKQPSRHLQPIIFQIKKIMEKGGQNIDMIIDLHSHSRKLGSFFYGNTLLHNPQASKVFPLYLSRNDQRFSFENSRFGIGNPTTARVSLFKLLKIPKIYTIQTSFYAYQKSNTKQLIQYKSQDFYKMGRSLMQNYASLIFQQDQSQIIQGPKVLSIYNKSLKEIFNQLKNQQLLELVQKQSVWSEQNVSEQQFQEDQLFKFLPQKKVQIISRKKNKGKISIKQKGQIASENYKLQKLEKNQKQKYQSYVKTQKQEVKLDKILHNKQKIISDFTNNYNTNSIFHPQDSTKRTNECKKFARQLIPLQPNNNNLATMLIQQNHIQKNNNYFNQIQANQQKPTYNKIIQTDIINQQVDHVSNSSAILKSKVNNVVNPTKLTFLQGGQLQLQLLKNHVQTERLLCVIGQKMQQKQVWIQQKNQIGIQTPTYPHLPVKGSLLPTNNNVKVNNNQDQKVNGLNSGRKSLKMPKFGNGVLAGSKQNNFVVRQYSLKR